MTDLRNKVNHQLQKLLEEPIHDKELKLFQDVEKLYQACSNVKIIENFKVSPLIEKIQTLGGWPVLRIYRNESNWKWEEIIQKLSQNGFSDNFIFSFFVNTKAMNSSRKLAGINAADLGLRRKYLLEKDYRYEGYNNNAQPSFFEALKEILNQTSKETIANYLMWRATFESLNYLNVPIRDRYFEYEKAIFGTKTQQTRVFQCIAEVKNLFPQGIGAMFYAFTENINNLTWMDNETKKAVKLKIKSMRDIIGSGDQLYNDTELERYYENRATEIDIENYFNSVLKIKAAKAKFNMNKLHFIMTKDDWTQYPLVVEVNAYMQFSHYHLKQCFIDQFNNITEPITGLHINGEQTQSENIADFGGVKFSYKAYEKFVEENGEEKLLPGIELNQRQLFWVAGAQFQCSVMRKELLEHWILSDIHAPYQFRVNAFGNLPEFSKDFKCSPSSAMNFIKKCELW
ncbi:hypothetical protein PVAND_001350 [Polypedilum vanderplanki]|uniref:Uncharacterized protein n=1 Tax=Polypedilum vanderplanki TaxID=319348 RepID=A0A9J6BMN4_POLVA|nr:hypothetical protein PVAND_001350 [Polypedilum vanderplanki]